MKNIYWSDSGKVLPVVLVRF